MFESGRVALGDPVRSVKHGLYNNLEQFMDSSLLSARPAPFRPLVFGREPSQHRDQQFYVSIKGVIVRDGHMLLLHKITGEWDLPGGRLNTPKSSKQCRIRKIREETGLLGEPGKLLH